jgi:hypothetical protein
MNSVQQEILAIFSQKDDIVSTSAQRLINLGHDYGWEIIVVYIAKMLSNTMMRQGNINLVLQYVQKLSPKIAIDIAFEASRCMEMEIDAKKDIFMIVLFGEIKSDDDHDSYFLSRFVYDDVAKTILGCLIYTMSIIISISASKCTLYELKVLRDWIIHTKDLRAINTIRKDHNYAVNRAMYSLTKCIEQFAGMKHTVHYSDIVIITQ